MRRYWTCSRCHQRWERTYTRCQTSECAGRKPKARVPKHAETLRDDSYDHYKEVAAVLHGVTDESCCVCGRARAQHRRHDRDHDHNTGRPRGLLCVRHNQMLDSRTSPDELRGLAQYLERAARYDECFPVAA